MVSNTMEPWRFELMPFISALIFLATSDTMFVEVEIYFIKPDAGDL